MNERFETFTVLISKLSRNIRKIKIMEMSEYGLRGVHVSCLYYLYSRPLCAAELCERCEEDKATISRGLDYLEENGFIECETKAAKRYKSPLILTDKGREAGKKVYDKVSSVLDGVSTALTENERVEFYKSLAKISDSLENRVKMLEDKQ